MLIFAILSFLISYYKWKYSKNVILDLPNYLKSWCLESKKKRDKNSQKYRPLIVKNSVPFSVKIAPRTCSDDMPQIRSKFRHFNSVPINEYKLIRCPIDLYGQTSKRTFKICTFSPKIFRPLSSKILKKIENIPKWVGEKLLFWCSLLLDKERNIEKLNFFRNLQKTF